MVVLLVIMMVILLAFTADTVYQKRRKLPVRLNPELDYAWGDGKDLTALAPDFAEILTTTTMAKLEADWDKAHPSIEDKLRARVKELEEQAAADSKVINKLNNEVNSSVRYAYRSAAPGTIVNLPNDMTEQQIQEFVKKWTLQAAKKAKNPGGVIRIPEMKVQTAAPIQASIVPVIPGKQGPNFLESIQKRKDADRIKQLQQNYESELWEWAKRTDRLVPKPRSPIYDYEEGNW